MRVNRDICIGCQLCIKDCIVSDILLVDQKAQIKNEACIQCGHCVAICPVKAVDTTNETEYTMLDVQEYDRTTFQIEPEQLLRFMKYRRSIRQFKKRPIEEVKIQQILEAGKYAQTGGNVQDVSYVVVQEQIDTLRAMTLSALKMQAEIFLQDETTSVLLRTYAKMWQKMYQDYVTNPMGEDKLFSQAPLLIIVKAKRPINGAIAATKMEMMIQALGLGTYFSGFLERALTIDPEIAPFLGIESTEQFVACLVVGYPKVAYKRTAPRKAIQVKRL